MSSVPTPPRKRTVTLDVDAFEQLEEYAKQQKCTPADAASCFVRAGIASQEFSARVEELLDQVESDRPLTH